MLFFVTKRDIQEIKACLKHVSDRVNEIHRVVFVDGNGLQGKSARAQEMAKEALARTIAIWTVLAFVLTILSGIIGYQFYRMDCLQQALLNLARKASITTFM